jgi:hypothetical protein
LGTVVRRARDAGLVKTNRKRVFAESGRKGEGTGCFYDSA